MFEGYLKLHGAPVGSNSTLPGFMRPNPNAWRVYISAVARCLCVGGHHWPVSAQARNLLCPSCVVLSAFGACQGAVFHPAPAVSPRAAVLCCVLPVTLSALRKAAMHCLRTPLKPQTRSAGVRTTSTGA